jgi:hypothetical protein
MCEVIVEAGICGFVSEVRATMDGETCALEITSNCENIQQLA